MTPALNDKPPNGTVRRDAAANRRKLLEAINELQRHGSDKLAMSVVAEHAGLGLATAYRYFPSLDDLRRAHLEGVITQLRVFSHDCTLTGPALFEAVTDEWIRLIETHGRSMIHLRSRKGVLTRLRDSSDPLTLVSCDAWERPIRSLMRNNEVPDAHFGPALMLWNVIFDAREVLDLLEAGMTRQEVRVALTGAYEGALSGWARAAEWRA